MTRVIRVGDAAQQTPRKIKTEGGRSEGKKIYWEGKEGKERGGRVE